MRYFRSRAHQPSGHFAPARSGRIVCGQIRKNLENPGKAGLFADQHLLDKARSRKLRALALLVAASLDVSLGFDSIARYRTEFE